MSAKREGEDTFPPPPLGEWFLYLTYYHVLAVLAVGWLAEHVLLEAMVYLRTQRRLGR